MEFMPHESYWLAMNVVSSWWVYKAAVLDWLGDGIHLVCSCVVVLNIEKPMINH